MLRWSKTKGQEGVATAPEAPAAPVAHPVPDAAPGPSSVPLPKKSLVQLLREQGGLGEEQLERCIEEQRKTGAFLGEILVQQGLLDEQSLLSFLAKHCRIPHLSLLDYLIDRSVLGLLPKETCLKYRLLPIDKMGNNLTVAMVNPLDAEALQHVKDCCPTLRIKPILCAYNHFETVTRRFFAGEGPSGTVELSVTSLGLKEVRRATAPAPHNAPVAATPEPEPVPVCVADTPCPEEIPDAVEAEPEQEPEPGPVQRPAGALEADSELVLREVFQETPAVSEDPAGEAPDLLREMASVMMDSMRDTYAMLARRMDLFQGVSPEDVARIFARGITREYEEGAVIFEQGQEGAEMFVILGGEVVILDGGRELAVLSRGDMFGEMALVSREPRSAGAKAACTTSLLALNLNDIKTDLPRDVSSQLLVNIVITLSERLRRANRE